MGHRSREVTIPDYSGLSIDSGEKIIPFSDDCSLLGVPHLSRLWHKVQLNKVGRLDPELLKREWQADLMLMDELKLGVEPTLQFIYQCNHVSEFEEFILDKNSGEISDSVIFRVNDALEKSPVGLSYCGDGVLSEDQVLFWQKNGYLIIPNVLTPKECEDAVKELCAFLNVSLDNPSSWYRSQRFVKKIMVQFFEGKIQEKIRRNDYIKQIFHHLWGGEQLTISVDRMSFNPPETTQWKFPGPSMHWDLDSFDVPINFRTQGLIYLTDTSEHQGAFCCVPGFHLEIDRFLTELPSGTDPQEQDWSEFNVQPVAAKAGSLIVWHHALPHGSSPNRAKSPRIVQYLNMYPSSTSPVESIHDGCDR